MTWIQGGTALSLGWVAWALYRRRPRLARLGFHVAAAFLGKWGELRLHDRVMKLLASEGKEPFDLVDSWRTA